MTADNSEILNFVGEQFRRLNARFDKLELDVLDLKMRASSVDEHLAGIMIPVSGIDTRLDRVEERLGRVDCRLDLTDAR